jgi:hypothetical protein
MLRGTLLAVAAALLAAPTAAGAQALDYAVYKTNVEPIFLKKREGYTRCVVCHHAAANNHFKLERRGTGPVNFTEEQSRKNFETVSKLVTVGNPEASLLLMYPLVPEEGGAPYHSGGRQWPSKGDPDWETIARWINGQKYDDRRLPLQKR